MTLKYFFLGFLVKVITGLDDTITHVPIIASVTKTRTGRIAFAIGIILAIIAAIIASIFLVNVIKQFPYYRYISAGLIFVLAAAIYFDVFVHKPRTKAEKKLIKQKRISVERFTQLVGIGFIAALATVIDDTIAYSSLFLTDGRYLAILGILSAALLEIFAVIYFSKKIAKIKYKEEIASAGLVMLGILILTRVI